MFILKKYYFLGTSSLPDIIENSDDSVADKDYCPSSSSSDSETEYKRRRDEVKRVLFNENNDLSPQVEINQLELLEEPTAENPVQIGPLNNENNDLITVEDLIGAPQVETNRFEPLEEPTAEYPGQIGPLNNEVPEQFQSPLNITRPTAESSTKKAPKKRKRNTEKWQKNLAKKARLQGKSYVSKVAKKKKDVEARSLKPSCTCRAKCFEKLSNEVRQSIFDNFWSECNNWEQRRQYVADRVTKTIKLRTRVNSSFEVDKRKFNYNYSLKVNDNIINVCKVMFLNTLSIGEKYVKITVNKKNESGMTENDRRGRHVPSNKTNPVVVESVKDHISLYPSYESHYTREKSKRRFLGPELNITLMYKQYKEKMENKNEKEYAKEWLYREIFNTQFNLSFKLPDVDTCDDCDKYKILIKDAQDEDKKNEIIKDRDAHLKKAEQRYSLKAEDKTKSYSDITKRTLLLDLQKCLPTPSLTNTQSFYLRKLWTLNLVINDATTKTTENFVWSENVAGRGGNEIASCILLWCQKHLKDTTIQEITVWTDNCAGQNRNNIVVACYLMLMSVYPHIKYINHKFLLKGHTHMEVDHIHSMIERKKKRLVSMEIITPHDWAQFIKTCAGRHPFNVNEMDVNSFKDFTDLYKKTGPFLQRKKNVKGNDFKISESVWWQFRKDKPGSLFYKTDFDQEDFEEVVMKRNLKKSNAPIPNELPNVRQTEKPISSAKYRDLQTLTTWIPEQFHSYYKNLPHQEGVGDAPEHTDEAREII